MIKVCYALLSGLILLYATGCSQTKPVKSVVIEKEIVPVLPPDSLIVYCYENENPDTYGEAVGSVKKLKSIIKNSCNKNMKDIELWKSEVKKLYPTANDLEIKKQP